MFLESLGKTEKNQDIPHHKFKTEQPTKRQQILTSLASSIDSNIYVK